jgi:hypothetical protein
MKSAFNKKSSNVLLRIRCAKVLAALDDFTVRSKLEEKIYTSVSLYFPTQTIIFVAKARKFLSAKSLGISGKQIGRALCEYESASSLVHNKLLTEISSAFSREIKLYRRISYCILKWNHYENKFDGCTTNILDQADKKNEPDYVLSSLFLHMTKNMTLKITWNKVIKFGSSKFIQSNYETGDLCNFYSKLIIRAKKKIIFIRSQNLMDIWPTIISTCAAMAMRLLFH